MVEADSKQVAETHEALEREWAQCLATFEIDASSVLQSRRYQRTYAGDDLIYKVQLRGAEKAEERFRYGDVLHEYQIVKAANGIRGVPRAVRFDENDRGRCAVYERISGEPLARRDNPVPTLRGLKMWRAVAGIGATLLWLSLRGIAHNDLRTHNIITDEKGRPYTIDFDQARRTSVPAALYINFLRLRSPGREPGVSYLYLLAWSLAPYVPKRLGMAIVRLFGYKPTVWPGDAATDDRASPKRAADSAS